MAPRKKTEDSQPEVQSPDPVLTLSLAPVRPTVDVDGKLYEMRLMKEFGIAKQQQLNRDGREFGQLWNAERRLNDTQQKRLKLLLDRLFKTVLIIPEDDDIADQFDDSAKADVVLHFTLAPLRKLMAAAVAEQAQETTMDDEEADEDS